RGGRRAQLSPRCGGPSPRPQTGGNDDVDRDPAPALSRRRSRLVLLPPPRRGGPAGDGTAVRREEMLVVFEDWAGRTGAFDSSSYLDGHPTTVTDVIAIGSYCGTRILAPIFSRGAKAVIATDAGIGKDEAGISGLKHGEAIGVPVATVAVMSAETSNGRSTLLGEVSRVNAPARALGGAPGMVAYEAAMRLPHAPPRPP